MIYVNRFRISFFTFLFCLFCTWIFSLSVFADGEEVIVNTEVIQDEVLVVDDIPESYISEVDIVEDAPGIEIVEVVPDEISADSLTVNANEVVLYSLLPEEDMYPSGAPLQGGVYMNLDTDQLGDILVYIPVDYQYDSFTLNSNGQPINITASTITGYSYDGNDYNIRWQSWGVPMYRPVNYSTGVQYQELTVNEIISSNVGFWAEGGVSYNYMLMYIMLGALILIIAFKIVGK